MKRILLIFYIFISASFVAYSGIYQTSNPRMADEMLRHQAPLWQTSSMLYRTQSSQAGSGSYNAHSSYSSQSSHSAHSGSTAVGGSAISNSRSWGYQPSLSTSSTLSNQTVFPRIAKGRSSAVAIRRIYRPGVDEVDDDGYYYDEDDEEDLLAPINGESNLTGIGAGTKNGQQVFFDGKVYEWDEEQNIWVCKTSDSTEVDVTTPVGRQWALLLFVLCYALLLVRKRQA